MKVLIFIIYGVFYKMCDANFENHDANIKFTPSVEFAYKKAYVRTTRDRGTTLDGARRDNQFSPL